MCQPFFQKNGLIINFARQVSELGTALKILGKTLPRIRRVTINPAKVPKGAAAAYHPLYNILYLDGPKPEVHWVAHEMTHAYFKFHTVGLSVREDEGMAYAVHYLIQNGLRNLKNLEKSARAGTCHETLFREDWKRFWSKQGTAGGYGKGTWENWLGKHDFALEDKDFKRAQLHLGLHISCKEISKVLNEALAESDCCFRLTCDETSNDPPLFQ
jgi:hypothetical protein